MEILGIGPLELLFILLIALIVIGPKDMLKTGRNLGKTLRKVVTSPQWQTVTRTSREIRNIPNRLIREAGLEEVQQELNGLKKTTADIQNTLRESTILPAGWAGLNKPVEASTNTKQPNPVIEQSIDPAIIIPSPDTESFSSSSSVATTDLDVLQSKGSTHPSIDLAAWILSPDEYDSAVDKENRDSEDDISAWITPPRSSWQKTTKKPKT
jgi:Sec-independent protein translocase protein TatA